MIRIYRGDEPDALADAREEHLSRAALRGAPAAETDFDGYDVNRAELIERLYYKCAYCEMDVREEALPVEHYHPKGACERIDWERLLPAKVPSALSAQDDKLFARRLPPTDRNRVRWLKGAGYWWLAWTWENHVMACTGCNTGLKRTRFPLRHGATPLKEHEQPSPQEGALLIDPTSVDPMDHIVFENRDGDWLPYPRDESLAGDWTIFVLHLNSPRLRDKYRTRAEEFEQCARSLDLCVARQSSPRECLIEWEFLADLLLAPERSFLAFAHDWLDARYPASMRAGWGATLRRPSLCLQGVSLNPSVRPPLPSRPELDTLPEPLRHFVRIARHHRTHEDGPALPDQLPLRELIARIRVVIPTITREELARLLARSPSTIARYLPP